MTRRLLAPLLLVAAMFIGSAPAVAESEPPIQYPQNVRVSLSGPDRIRWSWDSWFGFDTYRVAFSASRDMSSPKIRMVTGRWVTFTGLTAGRTYYVSVRASNDDGTFSDPSPVVAGRPGVVSKPHGTDATTAYSLSWAWPGYVGAARYELRFSRFTDADPYRRRVVSGTSTTFGDVERDSFYYLKVRALNSAGNAISGWSPIGRAATLYEPPVMPPG